MSNPVFYAQPQQLAALAPGSNFSLAGAEGRHAVTVKRLTAGEAVDVCDGEGLRCVCTVTSAEAGVLDVRVEDIRSESSGPYELVLVQALAKGDRDELAIETATELGVDAVVPWQAERSIVRWKMDKAVKGRSKWQHAVTAAAKQARRASIPDVGGLVGTAGLVDLIRDAALSLILHEDAVNTVPGVVRTWLHGAAVQEDPVRILMVVGPEGGMSAGEVEAFVAAGAHTALLGSHVLRSSTAGPAAVVLLSQELGRW